MPTANLPSYEPFLWHRAPPGKRDELIEVWRRHMPAATDGHEAYVYTSEHDDPDVVCLYRQYKNAHAATDFLGEPSYLA